MRDPIETETTMSQRKRLLTCACLLITSVAAAACSDDDASTGAAATTIAAPSTTAAASTTASPSTTTAATSTAAASTTAVASTTTEAPVTTADPSAASSRLLALGGNGTSPGCAAAVGRDGEVVWTDEVGLVSMEGDEPISSSTVFDIGSVSKQFTAAAVLELVLDGSVSLDDPLDRYFPDFPAWAKEMTLFDLMHHQSGIPDYEKIFVQSGIQYADTTTQAQTVETLSQVQTLDFAPRTNFRYSNSNYILLAEIVTMMSGTPFPQYVEETIFAPLGLEMILDPGPGTANKATSYNYQDGQYVDATSGWLQVGDGAIQTTPSQLVRWADNYRTGRFGGQEFLDLQLAGAVPVNPEFPIQGGGVYGAAIVVQPSGRLIHTGEWEGFYTTFVISSDRHHAVAISCNHFPSDGTVPVLIQTMGDTILDLWAGPDQ